MFCFERDNSDRLAFWKNRQLQCGFDHNSKRTLRAYEEPVEVVSGATLARSLTSLYNTAIS